MAIATPRGLKAIEEHLDLGLMETGESMLEKFRQDLRDVGLDLELFESRLGRGLRPTGPRFPAVTGGLLWAPLDLKDTGSNYEVRLNLPGVRKNDVELKFLDQTLEVSAETAEEKETEHKNYVYRERAEAGFHRRVTFPAPIVSERSSAKLQDGVLTVTVPKQKPAKEHRVTVE